MFSPVKAITAGALIFTLGGIFFVAQPFGSGEPAVPSAEAEFATPTEVTGTIESGECESPNWQGSGDKTALPGADILWTCVGSVNASDPRLGGTSAFVETGLQFTGNGLEESERMVAGCEADDDCFTPAFGLWHAARVIENDGGSWHQRPFVQIESSGTDYVSQNPVIHFFDGEGDYAGLIAVLEVTGTGGDEAFDWSDTTHEFWGYILDERQLPAVPEVGSVQ